jgi:phosphopantothenoylcysteine decarboxylase/phosphopantothenate--cysteine ligase
MRSRSYTLYGVNKMAEKQLILGVTGSISAFKVPSLIGILKEKGWKVRVIMTKNATKFIHPLTFATISGEKVGIDMFQTEKVWEDSHIALAQSAQIILIAPASANIIGKVASGIADDLLTSTIIAFTGTVIFAPAMNSKMWENPIVQENVKKLKGYGYLFAGPSIGKLANGASGPGRFADPDDIVRVIEQEAKNG